MYIITVDELNRIGGGSPLFLLELPHLIMGIREFTNYAVGCWQGSITRENDPFTNLIANMVDYV